MILDALDIRMRESSGFCTIGLLLVVVFDRTATISLVTGLDILELRINCSINFLLVEFILGIYWLLLLCLGHIIYNSKRKV